MQAYQIITHKQKNIILIDLSGGQPDEIIQALRDSQPKIAALPPKSALVLTNVKDTAYNSVISSAIKNFTDQNTPYVKASAVIGADGLRKVLLQTVAALTKREIKAFTTQLEAMDWLVSQA